MLRKVVVLFMLSVFFGLSATAIQAQEPPGSQYWVVPHNGCGPVFETLDTSTFSNTTKMGDSCSPMGVVTFNVMEPFVWAIVSPPMPDRGYKSQVVVVGSASDGAGWKWQSAKPTGTQYWVEPTGSAGTVFMTLDTANFSGLQVMGAQSQKMGVVTFKKVGSTTYVVASPPMPDRGYRSQVIVVKPGGEWKWAGTSVAMGEPQNPQPDCIAQDTHATSDGMLVTCAKGSGKSVLMGTIAVAPAFVDGPLPVGDILAVWFITTDFYNQWRQYSTSGLPVYLAKDKNIIVPVPLNPGLPKPPPHVVNHPRGEYTSHLKVQIWNLVMNTWHGGEPPDWCGKRDDGAWFVFFENLVIETTTARSPKNEYRGLALIVQTVADSGTESTAFDKVTWHSDGVPNTGTPRDDAREFDKKPCPPPPTLVPQ